MAVSVTWVLYLDTLWCGIGWKIGIESLSVLPLWEVTDLGYNLMEHKIGTWELVLCLSGKSWLSGIGFYVTWGRYWARTLIQMAIS